MQHFTTILRIKCILLQCSLRSNLLFLSKKETAKLIALTIRDISYLSKKRDVLKFSKYPQDNPRLLWSVIAFAFLRIKAHFPAGFWSLPISNFFIFPSFWYNIEVLNWSKNEWQSPFLLTRFQGYISRVLWLPSSAWFFFNETQCNL